MAFNINLYFSTKFGFENFLKKVEVEAQRINLGQAGLSVEPVTVVWLCTSMFQCMLAQQRHFTGCSKSY